ncbi:MAG: glycosyltransferase family 2 protein [Lachnospiraceae bacterium]|nr:glycosyltransferase family 2 protein [Lachnospiraceae bacterium]MBR4413399.1 glycosyltransferase family 2 protein [Lachnospiraceae bacterium]MBR5067624.1 glycosyltransferase family 2 protein [Lachnospiraceae bacterium]MBR5918117.1 glycosyltransferase family 2 protein [Lachnospiraceae bacterium]
MKLSVVIPNYNGIMYLEKCLAALDKQDFTDYDIIVVDDASTVEGIEETVKANPRAKFIKHSENRGFAASVNDGIKASDAEYIFLLNNDAYVDDGCLSTLVKAMDAEGESTFSIQCKMLSAFNHALIDNAGDFYNIFGWARTRGKDKLADSHNKPGEIFSSCAGAAIYRRSILNELGLFDENHISYLEDVDIGFRARVYGYVNKYEPAAKVFHEGSATSGSRYNEYKVKLAARNSILVRYKNQTVLQKIVNFPAQEAGIIIKQLFFIRKGLGKVYRAGIKEGRKVKRSEAERNRKIVFDSAKRKRALKIEFDMIKNIIY